VDDIESKIKAAEEHGVKALFLPHCVKCGRGRTLAGMDLRACVTLEGALQQTLHQLPKLGM
jgi:hypothetical protein